MPLVKELHQSEASSLVVAHRSLIMAILIPASFGRLNVQTHAQVSLRVSASAKVRTSRRDSSVDWVKETSSFFQEDKRPIMLFDGVCNLCNGGVKFVKDHDQNRSIRFEERSVTERIGKEALNEIRKKS